jgi:hypothetical protein
MVLDRWMTSTEIIPVQGLDFLLPVPVAINRTAVVAGTGTGTGTGTGNRYFLSGRVVNMVDGLRPKGAAAAVVAGTVVAMSAR